MTETTPPLPLSVILPTKDRPRLVSLAVQSVLAALADEEAEVIVVDDRSDVPVQQQLEISDPRLRILRNEGTQGAGGARNFGVAQARGARILFLDDDDLMLPGYPAYVRAQTADYGFSAIETFEDAHMPDALPKFRGGPASTVAEIRPFRRQIAGLGCGFWIDRAAFLKVGGIAEDLRVNEDTDFSIRLMAANLTGLRVSTPGVMIRQHGAVPGQAPHLTHAASKANRAGYFSLILSRNANWLATRPDALAFLRRRQIKLLIQAQDSKSAWEVVRQSGSIATQLPLAAYTLGEILSRRLRNR